MQPSQPNYIERMNTKRATAAQTNKEQSELAAMLAEMKKMQLASLMGAQGKSTVILTDQTDLGDKMKELAETIEQAILSTDTSSVNQTQLNELKNIVTAVRSIPTPKFDDSAILSAIKGLKLSTVVNVPDLPSPTVTVQERPIDFAPLIAALTKPETVAAPAPHIDLDDYRAQDIKDDGDKQYVGFVNPDGGWYIIENDVSGNKLRYVFGVKGYARAFNKAAQYEYKLLNEAISAAS